MLATSLTQSTSAIGGAQPLCLRHTLAPALETDAYSTRRMHCAGILPSARIYPFCVATKSAQPFHWH
eukprot:12951000-Alexandrium_andersonii.AAC.1